MRLRVKTGVIAPGRRLTPLGSVLQHGVVVVGRRRRRPIPLWARAAVAVGLGLVLAKLWEL